MIPQSEICTLDDGHPLLEPVDSIVLATFMPLMTLPKTTCLLSSQDVTAVVMKN